MLFVVFRSRWKMFIMIHKWFKLKTLLNVMIPKIILSSVTRKMGQFSITLLFVRRAACDVWRQQYINQWDDDFVFIFLSLEEEWFCNQFISVYISVITYRWPPPSGYQCIFNVHICAIEKKLLIHTGKKFARINLIAHTLKIFSFFNLLLFWHV